MKNLFLLFLTLIGVTGFANCESRRGCPGGPLTTLIDPCGFYVGLTGMYVVPSETGLGMFTDSWLTNTGGDGFIARSKPHKPKYKAAGAIKLGYDFGCSGNNIELEYTYLFNKTHGVHTTADDGPAGFGSVFFDLFSPGIFPVTSDSHLKYLAHQFDFKMGHHFVSGSGCLELHPFIGARYAKLRHDLTFLIGNVRSNYWGAGPLVGIDLFYSFCRSIGLTGHFDSALLFGDVDAHSILNFFGSYKFKSPEQHRLVPSLTGRLGLAYNCNLWCRSTMMIEFGYQANIFIGAFDTITATGIPVPPATLGARINSIETNNFAYTGPYLSLTWHM